MGIKSVKESRRFKKKDNKVTKRLGALDRQWINKIFKELIEIKTIFSWDLYLSNKKYIVIVLNLIENVIR